MSSGNSFVDNVSRLSFNSRDEAISFAKHTVEDSKRWFAAECPVAYQRFEAERVYDAARLRPWFKLEGLTWQKLLLRLGY